MTLDELESNRFGKIDSGKTTDERWAKTLGGGMTGDQYRQLSAAERHERVRELTLTLLKMSEQGERLGNVPGVVGPGLRTTSDGNWSSISRRSDRSPPGEPPPSRTQGNEGQVDA